MEKSPKTLFIVIAILVAVCCLCAVVFGAGAYLVFRANSGGGVSLPFSPNSPSFNQETPEPAPPVSRPPAEEIPMSALEALQSALVPENDPYELACALKNICNVPKTVPGKSYQLGDKEKFWIVNSDNVEHTQITATLMYETPHSYFWVEEGMRVNQKDMQRLMDTFENKIYPTDREFFGSEWTPGVDGDPRIFVIYADSIGSNTAGYFNSSDSYHPLVKPYSNGHETYVLGASQSLADEYTYGVLAHEFVHMIQFPTDRNDVSWLSEGFAELGVFLNGYSTGGKDYEFMRNPDLQLNTWVDILEPEAGAHYGASFLFFTYFLDRFGSEATRHLNANPDNDLESVDSTLAALNIADPQSGKPLTADDVFMDWALANYLQDGSIGDGRYVYRNYPSAPKARPTETISACPQEPLARGVHQYGADYIQISCAGDYTLKFSGSTIVGLLPVKPYSGKYAFWSNRGDESDMTLVREFDFTNIAAPIEINYRVWYDIEEDWDYLYLEASEDGKTWKILKTPSGTDRNLSGSSFGWAYTGASGGWIEESADLSEFAGKKVFVRFQYVTDAAVNGEGLLLDDVTVQAAGYFSDFETDTGGWQAAGFVRVENALPQMFRLALILNDREVRMIEVSPEQTAEIPLALNPGETATLVISGMTRFTRETASYQIEIR